MIFLESRRPWMKFCNATSMTNECTITTQLLRYHHDIHRTAHGTYPMHPKRLEQPSRFFDMQLDPRLTITNPGFQFQELLKLSMGLAQAQDNSSLEPLRPPLPTAPPSPSRSPSPSCSRSCSPPPFPEPSSPSPPADPLNNVPDEWAIRKRRQSHSNRRAKHARL